MDHARIIGTVVAVEEFDESRRRVTVKVNKASGFDRDHVNLMPKDWRTAPGDLELGTAVALVGEPYEYTRKNGSKAHGLRSVVLVKINQPIEA